MSYVGITARASLIWMASLFAQSNRIMLAYSRILEVNFHLVQICHGLPLNLVVAQLRAGVFHGRTMQRRFSSTRIKDTMRYTYLQKTFYLTDIASIGVQKSDPHNCRLCSPHHSPENLSTAEIGVVMTLLALELLRIAAPTVYRLIKADAYHEGSRNNLLPLITWRSRSFFCHIITVLFSIILVIIHRSHVRFRLRSFRSFKDFLLFACSVVFVANTLQPPWPSLHVRAVCSTVESVYCLVSVSNHEQWFQILI